MGIIFKNNVRYGGGGGGGNTIQLAIMPTASSINVNRIVQYIGETTPSFVNGYFYKCMEDRTSTPTAYGWVHIEVQNVDAKQPKVLDVPITIDGTEETTVEGALDTLNTKKANASSLGTASAKDFTTSVIQNSGDLVTSGAVWTAIDNLAEPMVFKGTLGTGGTITTLPAAAAANEGFTYKVITAGTYDSKSCKVGDVLVSNATEWVLIPAGDTDSDTWRNIKVNGTEKLGTGISSGAIDFVNGTNTTVAFNATGNTIAVSVPAVSSSSAGVAPKGAAVSSQSQSTKFLREDGSWAAPSYTTNTDTKVTSSANHYSPSTASGQDKTASASGATAAWSIDVVKGVTLNTDGKGHVTGLSVTSGKIPANPNTDTKVTSAANHYAPSTVSGQDKSASASGATAAWSIDVVKGVTLNTDGKGHVTGISVTSGKVPAKPTYTYSDVGAAASSHNQAASTITAGTLGGKVQANATAAATLGNAQVRDVYAGTSDMTAGTSALTTGTIYIVYE